MSGIFDIHRYKIDLRLHLGTRLDDHVPSCLHLRVREAPGLPIYSHPGPQVNVTVVPHSRLSVSFCVHSLTMIAGHFSSTTQKKANQLKKTHCMPISIRISFWSYTIHDWHNWLLLVHYILQCISVQHSLNFHLLWEWIQEEMQ